MNNEEVFARVEDSIRVHGWHTGVIVGDNVLLTELAFLGDAIGQFSQAERMNDRAEAGQKLADCMIRLVSVAMRVGLPTHAIARQTRPASVPMVVAYGALCRAAVLANPIAIERATSLLADSIWTTANQPRTGVNLIGAMSDFGATR